MAAALSRGLEIARAWRQPLAAALLVLAAGAGLRLAGLFRGEAAIHPPGAAESGPPRFYAFHPDETSLIDGARELADPLDPPLTSYGAFPLYLLRLGLEVAWRAGLVPAETPGAPAGQPTYAAARALSAAASALTLAAAWRLGLRTGSAAGALLGMALLAAAPLAIQQAHFYTVDSLFGLLCTLSMLGLTRGGGSRRTGIAAGLMIGLAGSTRPNGLLLAAVPAVAAVLQRWRHPREWPGAARRANSWTVWATAVITLLLLHPYLLTNPAILGRRSALDLLVALQIARGQALQPWTLQYLGTVPLLYHWTHLLPLAIGWPLALAATGALARPLRPAGERATPLLAWVLLYALSIGFLHAKPARYVLPLLPSLALLAGETLAAAWSSARYRLALRIAVAGTVACTVAYGVAFVRIYRAEDSRLQAGRWLARNVPAGTTLAVEGGAFTLQPILGHLPYPLRHLGIAEHFQARGSLQCSASLALLRGQIGRAEYLVVCDANRISHLAGMARELPVAASFYRELLDHRLGYRLVARFKEYPRLFGWRFVDDDAESSFIGFDHPAVLVFRRDPEPEVEGLWEDWGRRLRGSSGCADALLESGCAALREGRTAAAQTAFREAMGNRHSAALARYLAAASGLETGPGPEVGLPPEHPLLGLGLTCLGEPEMAVTAMARIATRSRLGRQVTAQYVARVAAHMAARGYEEPSRRATALSLELSGAGPGQRP